jgi:hypothetical protein
MQVKRRTDGKAWDRSRRFISEPILFLSPYNKRIHAIVGPLLAWALGGRPYSPWVSAGPARVVPANLDPLNLSLFTSVVSISGHLHILVQIGDFLQCHCCSFDPPSLHVSGIVSSIHRVHG